MDYLEVKNFARDLAHCSIRAILCTEPGGVTSAITRYMQMLPLSFIHHLMLVLLPFLVDYRPNVFSLGPVKSRCRNELQVQEFGKTIEAFKCCPTQEYGSRNE
eukprot:scpid90869/ scgid32901/ 